MVRERFGKRGSAGTCGSYNLPEMPHEPCFSAVKMSSDKTGLKQKHLGARVHVNVKLAFLARSCRNRTAPNWRLYLDEQHSRREEGRAPKAVRRGTRTAVFCFFSARPGH
jgi:hypothetical protein